MKRLTTILIFLVFTTLSYGQDGIRKCGSTPYSIYYKPIVIKSLSELPANIQDSIKKHLLNKLGKRFYKLLTFERGLVIDYQELISRDPDVLNYRWQVPKYELGFYIIQKQAGINYCCSRMTLDNAGAIIDNIDFPSYKINPKSTTFVNLYQIKKTAQKLGFNSTNYTINFVDDQIVLEFTRVIKYKYMECLVISAHSGQKVKQYKVTGIIDWY